MIHSFFHWRTLLTLVAVLIVSGTIFYSNYLSKKIEREEKDRIKIWAESMRVKLNTTHSPTLGLCQLIAEENHEIPIIETDEQGHPTGVFLNIDSAIVRSDTGYLRKKIIEFEETHQPILVTISNDPPMQNRYYFGNSKLLNEVKFYPIIQLIIIALFLIITIISIQIRNRSTQNQVWAGMAKETAHQLGTPVTSLEGWIEVLKEKNNTDSIVVEMQKDVERLKLITDRFGKIGSKPQLVPIQLKTQIDKMVEYIRRRSSDRITFTVTAPATAVVAKISPPLFDWVIENLLKNALDALENNGQIIISIIDEPSRIVIDIQDSGKGIPKKHLNDVFKPGFTTKKRGWGLGLSLSKRIIEQYHNGSLFVKNSELGKGTTFRIILPV
ncbi:MAG: sensor histidine kinase [Ferruginibacter sp.]